MLEFKDLLLRLQCGFNYRLPLIAQTITNDYCSFEIPTGMEIEGGWVSEWKNSSNLTEEGTLFKVTLQQKGLNDVFDDLNERPTVFDDYCRIIISCEENEGYDVSDLNSEDLAYYDKYLQTYLDSVYKIVSWEGTEFLTFKGYSAYVTEYIRESVTKGKGDVHVYMYTISSEKYIWNITFSTREANINKWKVCFESFVESLEINDNKSVGKETPICEAYVIDGTSQNFIWMSRPVWEKTYIQNSCYIISFNDSYQSGLNQVVIGINTYDFSPSGINLYSSQNKKEILEQYTKKIKESFYPQTTIENKLDKTKLTYSYKCNTSMYGQIMTVVVFANFSGNNLVCYLAMYDKDYQFAEKEIVEPYLNQFKQIL